MTEPGSAGDAAHRPSTARRRVVDISNVLVLLVTVAGALWGLWWLYDRLANVYVLDARITADMLLLSSQVAGWIVEVPVEESQRVRAGQVLLRIDDRRARAEVAALEAGLDVLDADIRTLEARIDMVTQRTRSHVEAARARLEAAQSELAAAEGDLEIADADWQRAQALREGDLVSQQEFEAARNVYRSAVQAARRRRAEVATARADLAEARAEEAEIGVLRSELEALSKQRVQRSRELDRALAELEYHTIESPVDGVVDELFVDPGEHVSPGQRVLVMHDPSRIWVSANVKETDLRHIELGEAVAVRVDAYPDRTRRGVVERVGDAATSQFALLPNPNPSGNFTKITQRVEVKIRLDEHDPSLKPGMMVEVKIPRS